MSTNKNDPVLYPERMGAKWDDDEVLKLLKSIRKKKSIYDIAIEHQRTTGAINSRRRKLAVDYWFNDKRPIEEIIKFTGLTREEIETAIKRRAVTKDLVYFPSNTEEVIVHYVLSKNRIVVFIIDD